MADETVESSETPEEQPQQTEGSRLREERNAAKAEATAMRNELIQERLGKMGLSADEGLGVAIAESFDGVPTLDNLRAHAAEKYKYQTEPAVPAEAVNEPAQRIEGVVEGSTPVTPTPAVDPVAAADTRLAEADASRADAQASISEKMSRYREMRQSGQIVPQ